MSTQNDGGRAIRRKLQPRALRFFRGLSESEKEEVIRHSEWVLRITGDRATIDDDGSNVSDVDSLAPALPRYINVPRTTAATTTSAAGSAAVETLSQLILEDCDSITDTSELPCVVAELVGVLQDRNSTSGARLEVETMLRQVVADFTGTLRQIISQAQTDTAATETNEATVPTQQASGQETHANNSTPTCAQQAPVAASTCTQIQNQTPSSHALGPSVPSDADHVTPPTPTNDVTPPALPAFLSATGSRPTSTTFRPSEASISRTGSDPPAEHYGTVTRSDGAIAAGSGLGGSTLSAVDPSMMEAFFEFLQTFNGPGSSTVIQQSPVSGHNIERNTPNSQIGPNDHLYERLSVLNLSPETIRPSRSFEDPSATGEKESKASVFADGKSISVDPPAIYPTVPEACRYVTSGVAERPNPSRVPAPVELSRRAKPDTNARSADRATEASRGDGEPSLAPPQSSGAALEPFINDQTNSSASASTDRQQRDTSGVTLDPILEDPSSVTLEGTIVQFPRRVSGGTTMSQSHIHPSKSVAENTPKPFIPTRSTHITRAWQGAVETTMVAANHDEPAKPAQAQGLDRTLHERTLEPMPANEPLGTPTMSSRPVVARVENQKMAHISDPPLRNYKLNAVDSDGSSRIQVIPVSSDESSGGLVYAKATPIPEGTSLDELPSLQLDAVDARCRCIIL
ncbi:expressed unknown protein [Seminavis robusta]|uniref:Uncharacterized protein n=1 Tax=Seminavis robusta TaxID=568900 RepID=A0A9N8EQK9_9STRA|nr:expressed unknown protein [Seminavis robusta]|eukprot:Sro1403_g269660.1 n/a (687) ;mRNA; r:8915-10975